MKDIVPQCSSSLWSNLLIHDNLMDGILPSRSSIALRAHSEARDKMLERTHTVTSPWTVVRAGDKEHARLNVISDVLWRLNYPGKHRRLQRPDPAVVFPYGKSCYERGLIEA